MTHLHKLIEAVEAGTLDAMQCGQYGSVIAPYCNGCTITFLTLLHAHDGSLDAAKALHEALLPGWEWMIANKRSACVSPSDKMRSEGVLGQVGKSEDNPARAWLLAILKAYEAQT